jgi:mevalonate kinase
LFNNLCDGKIIKKNFYIELSNYIVKNHNLLNKIGVGDEKLDDIVKTAKEFDFFSKLTGAGGGFFFLNKIKKN